MAIIRKYWDWICIWFPGSELFGALLLAGNTVPALLLNFHFLLLDAIKNTKAMVLRLQDEGRRFFLTTLICGAFLFVTGLILKML